MLKIMKSLVVIFILFNLVACSSTEVTSEEEVLVDEVEETDEVVTEETLDQGEENLVYIQNGDFEKATENWITYFHADAAGEFIVVEGQAQINVQRDGLEDYSIHLYQDPFSLVVGDEYVLKFKASSSIPRELLVVLDNTSYERKLKEQFSLSTDMTEYEMSFTAVEELVSLKFLIGELGDDIESEYSVYFDQIELIKN